MDVGTKDEFGFARHYDNLVARCASKGLTVGVQDGFGGGNCADLPDNDDQFRLVRYDAGHVGVAEVDPDDLLHGDVCGDDTVWQRLLSLLGYLDKAFPDGFDGPGGDAGGIDIDLDDFDFDVDFPDPDLRGDIVTATIDSPALATGGGAVPTREVLVYRPPAFHRTDREFPVVYFLGGYGQQPEDFERLALAARRLILTGQLQNMFVRRSCPAAAAAGLVLRQPLGARGAGARDRAGHVGPLRGLDPAGPDPGDRERHPQTARQAARQRLTIDIRPGNSNQPRITRMKKDFADVVRGDLRSLTAGAAGWSTLCEQELPNLLPRGIRGIRSASA